MIFLIPCPECGEASAIHATHRETVEAVCPACGHETRLQLNNGDRLRTWVSVEEVAVEIDEIPFAETHPESKHIAEQVQALAHETASAPIDTEIPIATKISSTFKSAHSTRYRRRSTSPIWTMLQIFIGGVAAVPIALTIIWHVIGTDIAGAGPWVGQHLPWLVPLKFRPSDQRFPDLLDESRAEGLPQVNWPDGPETANAFSTNPTVNGTKGLDWEASPEMNSMIEELWADVERWKSAEESDSQLIRELAQSIYSKLCILAVQLGDYRSTTSLVGLPPDFERLLVEFRTRSDLRAIITQGASYWSQKNRRGIKNGLVVIVPLLGTEKNGDSWLLETSLANSKQNDEVIVTIEIPTSVASIVSPAQSALIFGTLADFPAEHAPEIVLLKATYLQGL
ncbi:MAG: hypothetical protein KDB03_15920 [Planctomycetales bacterium]|nr:hypothetical protein [Planctomycetales bacterium]